MFKYSTYSQVNLASCDIRLQRIFNKAIEIVDISIVYGHRGFETQEVLFSQGLSKKRGGESKHNLTPSLAIDAAMYPIDTRALNSFYYLAGIVKAIAALDNVKIRWGGDWDMDNCFTDQTFNDLYHYELID